MMSAFENAVIVATMEDSRLADFARASAGRFGREYPQSHRPRGQGELAVREVTLRVGRGEFGAGRGTNVELGLDVTASLGSHFVLSYGPALNVSGGGSTSIEQPRMTLVGKLGSWWVSAGRQQLAFGPATGGLILNGAAAFDGVMVGSDGPFRLGSIGRWLGPIQATGLLSRLPSDTLGGAAWFGAARLTIMPHPRVQIGLNRTAVVAADDERLDVGLGALMRVAIGKHTRPNIEDQRASVDVSVGIGGSSWRVVPYFEWGFEDSAGAYIEDPGLTLGAFVPFLPGLPAVSLRYEYTAFGESARTLWSGGPAETRKWYRHSGTRAAYIGREGQLIGHPLGGYGYEHRVNAAAWILGSDARVYGTLVRRRRDPVNLLYERRPGQSHGLGLGGSYRFAEAVTVETDLWWEKGDRGWRDREVSLGARVVF